MASGLWSEIETVSKKEVVVIDDRYRNYSSMEERAVYMSMITRRE